MRLRVHLEDRDEQPGRSHGRSYFASYFAYPFQIREVNSRAGVEQQ